MPKKNYVFDTNVLIQDPDSIFRFQDNDIYIPIYVLEEIDGLKNDPGERGRQAREVARKLDDIRTQGKFTEGIQLNPESGKLFIYTPTDPQKLPISIEDKKDNAILATALTIKNSTKENTILVTMDINMRIRAEALDMQVAPYEYQSVDVTDLGNKVVTLDLLPDEINDFFRTGLELKDDLDINSSVLLTCLSENKGIGRVREINDKKYIVKIDPPRNVLGISPKNAEQKFALDLLCDENIKLVTLMGLAGTGKTLLALSAGLNGVLEGKYSRLLISKPIVTMGKDIGALPGELSEKMRPFMASFYDNLDYIAMTGGIKKTHKRSIDDLFEEGLIQIEPLTYIRGRSIPGQFIITDECQNLSVHEIKTLITRCGENTKLVLCGDPAQIDSPYLDKKSNGFSVCVKKMRNNNSIAHITLEHGQRSALANFAANLL